MITTFGWGGPPVLVLDENPGACAAYSLRRLSGLYNGPAIRVRRSSDNAEQDIYFTDTFGFDITAFNAFVGASTAYVKTWYDQSGNGMHVSQTSTANQPQINGIEIIFDGSTNYLRCSTWIGFTYTGAGSVYLVANVSDKSSGNITGTFFNQSDITGGNELSFSIQFYPIGGFYGTFYGTGCSIYGGGNDKNINQYYIVNANWQNWSTHVTDGNTKVYFNNVENNPYQNSGSINPPSLGIGKFEIGKDSSNFGPYHLNGKLKELILYPFNSNNGLNSNINNAYGIY